MTDVTTRVERRGGKRYGPPKSALCGHFVEWFPGPYKKSCGACLDAEFADCRRCGARCGRRGILYCSRECSDIAAGRRLLGPRFERECALPECDARFSPPYAAVRCCSEKHGKWLYNRESRADGRQVNEWNDRRRSNAQARRARQAGSATNASVYLSEVIERDGLRCGICGDAVDMSLVWPHPMSRSVDHIFPIAKGGAHAPENCQLAHLACNVRKGARVA